MKAKKISSSRISQYTRCPSEYYYDRHTDIEPRDLTDNSSMHYGSIMHEVLETIRRNPEHQDISDVIMQINKNYKDYTLNDNEFEEMINLVKNWFRTRDISLEVLDVEKRFKVPLRDFYITGIMDVVEKIDSNSIRVRDYKTGYYFKDINETKNSTQLKLYTLAAMEIYDVDNIEVAFDQVRYEAPEFIQYSKEELRNFIKYVISIQNKIKIDTEHEARPGRHCAWCGYTHKCKKIQEQLEFHNLSDLSMDELTEKYQQIRAKEKVINDEKDMLKDMITGKMSDNKMEEFENDKMTVRKTQRHYVNYKPSKVLEFINEENIDNIFKVNKSKLKDLDDKDLNEIEKYANHSYSNPYIRVSEK